MDGDVNTIITIPGASDLIGETKRTRVRLAILLLLEGQKIIGGDTPERVFTARQMLALDDGGDGDHLRLFQRRG